jgi:hypothetical protein
VFRDTSDIDFGCENRSGLIGTHPRRLGSGFALTHIYGRRNRSGRRPDGQKQLAVDCSLPRGSPLTTAPRVVSDHVSCLAKTGTPACAPRAGRPRADPPEAGSWPPLGGAADAGGLGTPRSSGHSTWVPPDHIRPTKRSIREIGVFNPPDKHETCSRWSRHTRYLFTAATFWSLTVGLRFRGSDLKGDLPV